MKSILSYALAAAAILPSCSAFSTPSLTALRRDVSLGLHNNNIDNDEDDAQLNDRRSALSTFAALPLGIIATTSTAINPMPANAAGKGKVVVFGGSGWVGTHVCKYLTKDGYDVISISRSSPDAQNKRAKSIIAGTTNVSSSSGPSSISQAIAAGNKRGGFSNLAGDEIIDTSNAIPGVQYLSIDAISASENDLVNAMKGAKVVISTVGISPTKSNKNEGNSVPNARIAKAAKAAGVSKFVYVGVATSLSEGPAAKLVAEYLEGKKNAETAVKAEFGGKALIIKPSSVSGATPGEIRPPAPGPRPVPVYALAKLIAAGAVGDASGEIDGNEAIVALEGCKGKKGCDF